MGQQCGCIHAPKDTGSTYQMNLVPNASSSSSNIQVDPMEQRAHRKTEEIEQRTNAWPKSPPLSLFFRNSSRHSVSCGNDSDSASTPPDENDDSHHRPVLPIPSMINIHLTPFRSANHTTANRPRLTKPPLNSSDQSDTLVPRKKSSAAYTPNARLTPLYDQQEHLDIASWNPYDRAAGDHEMAQRAQTNPRWNLANSASFHFSGVDNVDLMLDAEECDRDYRYLQMLPSVEGHEQAEKLVFGYMRLESDKFTTRLSVPSCIMQLCLMHFFSDIAVRPIRRKRVVFTSIPQLNLCIDRVPNYVLDESLFFFHVHQRTELLSILQLDHDDKQHAQEVTTPLEERPSLKYLRDIRPKFKQYLQRKYDDNMLLVLDIHSSWHDVSKQLTSILDPWYHTLELSESETRRQKHYKPLLLDETYWRTVHKAEDTKYSAQISEIVEEIHSAKLKYAPSMEIMWQSNPTLIPMKHFDLQQYQIHNGLNKDYLREREIMSRDTMVMLQSPMAMAIDSHTATPTAMTDTLTLGASNADLVILSQYEDGNDGINDSVGNSDATSMYTQDESYTQNLPHVSIDFGILNDTQMFSNLTGGRRTPRQFTPIGHGHRTPGRRTPIGNRTPAGRRTPGRHHRTGTPVGRGHGDYLQHTYSTPLPMVESVTDSASGSKCNLCDHYQEFANTR